MTAPVIISSDSHIVEPPDLYTTGMPSKLLHRAPVMKRYKSEDGKDGDAWFIGDTQIATLGGVTQRAGDFMMDRASTLSVSGKTCVKGRTSQRR